MTTNEAALIVFDLDGTLLDTLADLAAATNWALRKHGLSERSVREVRSFVGNGTRRLMERALAAAQRDEAREVDVSLDALFQDFTAYYDVHLNDSTSVYPGIFEALASLRAGGYRLGMLSNKPHPAVLDLAALYFPEQFDYLAGQKPGVPLKPDPAPLLSMMDEAGVRPEQTVYIGDSEPDAQCSRAAGAHGVGVLWGFRDAEELQEAGMEHLVSEASELPALCAKLLTQDMRETENT